MRHLPNILTILRIPLSLSLLLIKPLTGGFVAVYLICCLTDVLDGYIARRIGAQTAVGARLDSAADFILVAALLWTLWPVMAPTAAAVIWGAAVAVIRLTAALIARVRFGKWCFLHTWSNKLTGGLLGLYPLSLLFIQSHWPLFILLAIAGISGLEELLLEILSSGCNPDIGSIFRIDTERK